VTRTLANGDRPKLTAMVYINGKMETDMRENGETVSSTDREQIFSLTGTCTLASTSSASLMDSASTNGRTAAITLAISRTV